MTQRRRAFSSVVGVAFDRGLIPSVRDTVWKAMAPIYRLRLQAPSEPGTTAGESYFIDPFATPHNREITWDDMLRQTSDWEGTLWGKPDWADRPSQNPAEWRTRKRAQPGTTYEYNDVRVNVLALAATNVWRRPLPEVLRDNIMDPIGASASWRWFARQRITLDGGGAGRERRRHHGAAACSSTRGTWRASLAGRCAAVGRQADPERRGEDGADADRAAAHLRVHELVLNTTEVDAERAA
jgi:CubicO group peptidase (beta-lactamase class C family)